MSVLKEIEQLLIKGKANDVKALVQRRWTRRLVPPTF